MAIRWQCALLGRIARTQYIDAAYCYSRSIVFVWLSAWALQKRLNQSRCLSGCGLVWFKKPRIMREFGSPKVKGDWGGISRPIEKYLGYLAWAKVIRLVAAAMRPFAVSIAATCCILSKSDQRNIIAMVKRLQPMCQVSLTSSSLCPEKIWVCRCYIYTRLLGPRLWAINTCIGVILDTRVNGPFSQVMWTGASEIRLGRVE